MSPPLCLTLLVPVRYELLCRNLKKLVRLWLMVRMLVASFCHVHDDERCEGAGNRPQYSTFAAEDGTATKSLDKPFHPEPSQCLESCIIIKPAMFGVWDEP